jgi:hypothetical protein
MGGLTNGPFDNGMAQMITTGGTMPIYDQWPWQQTVYYPYQQFQSPPAFCSGDVHVFPCPHCDKCKCGKATVKRDAKKK